MAEKYRGSRPLGELVDRAIDPLAARQGFGEAALILRWEAVVGARLAAICEPVKLQWPPRAKNRPAEKRDEPATLVLRVEPGFGLDIQHMTGAILDRVNTHLGWRCVARLAMRQEPLASRRAAPRRAPAIDVGARARAVAATEGVADDALRAALTRLGERALRTR
ncbi:DUF721 domain-containing protein [Methylosinus sp. Sm6]|uniref:DUF721 domain-containing protein n=1 Tax=Methylosinus sp. Sm6 TaxID=2866948 RepID=UPI001C990BD4|nr:DciA family protein [Methylosinus sp. Sm6]MBY6242103.1 DciA family protein [Methylosinus sp. Sm6]